MTHHLPFLCDQTAFSRPKTRIDALNRYTNITSSLILTADEEDAARRCVEGLPSMILDAHVHLSRKCAFRGFTPSVRKHVGSTFAWFEDALLRNAMGALLPGMTTNAIVLPHPYPGIDHRDGNQYVVECAKRIGVFPVMLADYSDRDYSISALTSGHYVAVKVYPALWCREEGQGWLPAWLASACASVGLPIVVHPLTRLPDFAGSLCCVCRRWPKLKIVVAHMGLQYLAGDDTKCAFEAVSHFANVYFDSSMVTDIRVFEAALRALGPDRVMFGSDLPISLIRARYVYHPHRGVRLATAAAYHWVDPAEQEEYASLASGAIQIYLQTTAALKEAVMSSGYGRNGLDLVFRDNAMTLYGNGAASYLLPFQL